MPRDDRLDTSATGPAGSARNAAQRDRDRILYTSAFRRLAGVTQVAAAAEGHAYHNRLTHTLEVSQLARRIAERIEATADPGVIERLGGINADVAEAAALAHDLGHPPFGHVGESELDICLKRVGVADGFEGNAQSFRIVTSLAMRTVEPIGLNLTRATLNAVLKYPWSRGTSGKESRKFGYYATEKQHFDFARAEGPGANVKSLEAEIMDRADDVAYAVHDAFDFYRAGLIPLHTLAHSEAEWSKFVGNVRDHWASLPGSPSYNETAAFAIRERILAPYIPTDPFNSTTEHRGQLRSWSSVMITRFVAPEAFDVNGDFNGTGSLVRQPDRDRTQEIEFLKELTRYYVIRNPATQTVQYGQRRIIRGLFDLFYGDESLDQADDGTRTSPYPPGLAEAVSLTREISTTTERNHAKARVVADAISQMTEEQAVSLYRRLTGGELGSMFDAIVR